MKIRLLFLKGILQEKPESLIYKFLQLQFEHPTKGDWSSTCVKDLKDLNIDFLWKKLKTFLNKNIKSY